MTVDLSSVRKQLAARLAVDLSGLVERVFDHQVGDFRGMSPIVLVTRSGAVRASAITAEDSNANLEVHTFVLYSLRPLTSTDDVNTGSSVDIPLTDTSPFVIGEEILVEDEVSSETAIVSAITTGSSITVVELFNSYTLPKIYFWTESKSEDLLDRLEYEIAKSIRAANDDDDWTSIMHGDESTIDVVDVGGDGYRHETIPVKVTVQDF